jgi:hypothetical protein
MPSVREAASVAGADFDVAVQEFLHEYAVPKRLREARVAER